jgi:hypothetical protein
MSNVKNMYNTEDSLKYFIVQAALVLPIFLYWSENWTLTALQRRRTEAEEIKLLRRLAGYTLYDHKTNRLHAYYTRQMNTDGTGFYACKEYHQTESL